MSAPFIETIAGALMGSLAHHPAEDAPALIEAALLNVARARPDTDNDRDLPMVQFRARHGWAHPVVEISG